MTTKSINVILDFELMQLEQAQYIYATAEERDGDDDDKDSAGELVEKFAMFIHDKLQKRHTFFLQKINGVGFSATAFCYELMLHEQTKIILRVEETGDCRLKHLFDGNSSSVLFYRTENFKDFFSSGSEIERFFRNILQNNF